jgi:hypothetical protein
VDDDTVLAFTIGSGGGYGDPLERDPARVLADLRAGFISPETARRVFRVAVDPQSGDADERESDRLRREEREARKRRALPLREFVKTWSRQRPPEELLRFYGPWPDPGRAGYPGVVIEGSQAVTLLPPGSRGIPNPPEEHKSSIDPWRGFAPRQEA